MFRECRAFTPTAELPDGSQDRASGGPVGLFQCAPEMIRRTARCPQKFGWLPAALPPSPVPDAPRQLLPRRPARHAVSRREPGAGTLEAEDDGTRKLCWLC